MGMGSLTICLSLRLSHICLFTWFLLSVEIVRPVTSFAPSFTRKTIDSPPEQHITSSWPCSITGATPVLLLSSHRSNEAVPDCTQSPFPLPCVIGSDESVPVFSSWDYLLGTSTRSGRVLSSLPRFLDFCKKHQHVGANFEAEGSHIPNLLQGGAAAGPLAKTSTPGQIVRLAAAYTNLTAEPVHSLTNTFAYDDLSWVSRLQQELPAIQAEVRRVIPTLKEELWQSLRTRRGTEWSDETGWAHIALVDNFRIQENNMSLFPETFRILNNVVGAKRRIGPRLCAIARQKAGTGIPEHCDYMNWMLTLHTALWGPAKGCGIEVNGVKRDWTVGNPAVMDTTFKHRTYNESGEDLYILIVDFWHPDLSIDEIDALRSFFAVNSGV